MNCGWAITCQNSEGGALECNLTGRFPFFMNLHNPFRKKIYISIPCFGIIRLPKIPKSIEKTIAYCSWTNSHNLFRNLWSISYPVQEFMLENDTLKNDTSRIGLYRSAPPPPSRSESNENFRIGVARDDKDMSLSTFLLSRQQSLSRSFLKILQKALKMLKSPKQKLASGKQNAKSWSNVGNQTKVTRTTLIFCCNSQGYS